MCGFVVFLFSCSCFFFFFFFNDTATTEIYTLSLHDALPISGAPWHRPGVRRRICLPLCRDRKSTRLNSSHANISYAVFCLKKKKKQINIHTHQQKQKKIQQQTQHKTSY